MAQGLQICHVVRPTHTQRYDVIDISRQVTAHNTLWIAPQELRPDLAPCVAITSFGWGATLLITEPPHTPLMHCTPTAAR